MTLCQMSVIKMNINERQKQININIQKKANLIWNSATHIYGLYKEHEYGKVILPFTVLKRFDDEPNIEYTEANMNIGVDGKATISDYIFFMGIILGFLCDLFIIWRLM